jgi:hypothetical protein
VTEAELRISVTRPWDVLYCTVWRRPWSVDQWRTGLNAGSRGSRVDKAGGAKRSAKQALVQLYVSRIGAASFVGAVTVL